MILIKVHDMISNLGSDEGDSEGFMVKKVELWTETYMKRKCNCSYSHHGGWLG